MAGKCQNAQNQNKVMQRFIQDLKRAKNDNPQIIGEPSKETSCKVRKSPVDVSQSKGIPEGLIMAIVHRAS